MFARIPIDKQRRIVARAPWALGLTLAVVSLSFGLFCYRPLHRRSVTLTASAAAAQEQALAQRQRADSLPRVRAEVAELRAQLADASPLPLRRDLGQFIRNVTFTSQQQSLANLTVLPGVPQRDQLCATLPITLGFQGDFLSACAFLREADRFRGLSRIARLDIQSADPQSGSVAVQVSMNLYSQEE